MASLRVAQKELTRKRLLSTALELFEKQGYSATTIDEIAGAAGTTRVTFYAHFPSRREIMRALIDELNELLERSESADHGSTAVGLVEAVRIGTADALGPWLRAQASRWPAIRPYILAATEAAAVDGELREVFHAWFDEVADDIAEGLTQAGRFDPEGRHVRGDLAVGMLDRTALNWMTHEWPVDSDVRFAVLVDAWVALLGD
ncbi:TetR/AcrR family transcriptional regulator [Microbacterium fluvii]|uniref:TetR/AcrR family transcriptional regulator n=1 Tax=Microbacterium fluvii TaxID=415215 RepID=A0ABW2HDB1_9MICO|nr:TetR/AcrR family transcriptional regulator [Microbacterium fluvii]MCU4672881.1 TetR/AcrR family transcriptional regulator [Microbacterium fluvii]